MSYIFNADEWLDEFREFQRRDNMKVFVINDAVINDAYNFYLVGVIRAETKESALTIAEKQFWTPLSHKFEAFEFELVEAESEVN